MFVRKKPNKSGVISVQVISKINGKSKLIKTIGSSREPQEIEALVKEGHHYISKFGGQKTLDFSDEPSLYKSVFESISSHTEVGTQLLLGKIFDDIGFNVVEDDLFRRLVLSRLVYPASKMKTSDFLDRYRGVDYPVQQIYRYMISFIQKERSSFNKSVISTQRESLGGK